MPDVAEVHDVYAVQLHREGDVPAPFAAFVLVAERPDARDEDVLDLVLARPVEAERLFQADG